MQQISPVSTTALSDDTQYSSVLLKKKLAMLDHASKNTSTDVSITNDTITNTNPVLIKPSSTTLSINENEPVKSASRVRKMTIK
jgi:hypothetical protein